MVSISTSNGTNASVLFVCGCLKTAVNTSWKHTCILFVKSLFVIRGFILKV